MLVLSRKPGESIVLADNITVRVLKIGTKVLLGIEAPDNITIRREELQPNGKQSLHPRTPPERKP